MLMGVLRLQGAGLAVATFSCLLAQAAIAQERSPGESPPARDAGPDAGEALSSHERLLEVRVEELEKRLSTLSEQIERERVDRLSEDARNEAQAGRAEAHPEEREFLEGSLALQRLNPELTFTGDMLAVLIVDGGRHYVGESDRSGLPVRFVDLHFQHVLDPYSMFKSALGIGPEHGLHLGEVYVTWFGIVPSLSFTLGRFRQGFGVLNRWHEHDLDQTSYPLAMTAVLGEDGLVGDGFALKWMMPALWASANELALEVVDGNNQLLFSGEHYSIPTTMLHLKNYYDLADSTYLELGLTGMLGFNNKRGLAVADRLVDEPWRRTMLAGTDLTLYWSPPQQARYRSLTWRSEGYYASRQTTEGGQGQFRQSWGVYSYLQYQLSARWFAGVRGDLALPTERANDDLAWDIVPYLTVWQSEFVYLRFEYRHGREIPTVNPDGTLGRRTDNRFLVQVDFAAGPHKHEKY